MTGRSSDCKFIQQSSDFSLDYRSLSCLKNERKNLYIWCKFLRMKTSLRVARMFGCSKNVNCLRPLEASLETLNVCPRSAVRSEVLLVVAPVTEAAVSKDQDTRGIIMTIARQHYGNFRTIERRL